MSRVVVFAARCPQCGTDARWSQRGDDQVVKPEDFSVDCERCQSDAA